MRNFMIALTVSLGALATLGSPTFASEAKQDFNLVNKTGYELKEVYVSPNKADDWQEDVLGTGTLADGGNTAIHFHRATTTCKWDLKVVYTDDDSEAVWKNIDLCAVEKITIKYDRKKNVTNAFFD